MTDIALPAPQIIEISGPDAIAFAQAQFSSNLNEFANGYWQWSAWLSAQGRVRAFFHLLRISDEKLWLILRGGDAQHIRDGLSRYVLRAKAALSVVSGMQAMYEDRQNHEAACLPMHHRIVIDGDKVSIRLPAKPEFPRWLALTPATRRLRPDDRNDTAGNRLVLADIDAGLVWLDPVLEEKLLPAWIGLDSLGATSTNKGCYPGQEIVARLHFKGGNKRWLYRIGFAAERLPAPGTTLGDGGIVVCSAHVDADHAATLAVLDEQTAEFLRSNTTSEIIPHSIERIAFQ